MDIQQILKCKSVSSKRHRRQGEALQASAQGNALWSSVTGVTASPIRAKAYVWLPPLQGLDVPLLYLHRALPCAGAFGALPLRCTSLERYYRVICGIRIPQEILLKNLMRNMSK